MKHKKNLIHLLFIAVFISTGTLLAGCVSSSFGTEINTSDVEKIQKGTTTREQIVQMFGQPMHTSMLGDGRRVLSYSYTATKAKATGASFIPIVGPIVGGARGESRMQTLQVILNADGVVEDYELNDNASQIRGGVFGTKATPIAPPAEE